MASKSRDSKASPGCDMRGMLSFMILFLLSKRSMYGQELAAEIGRRKGEKPNPGTIYPALKELTSKGLVEVRREGRTTNYELTKEGRKIFIQSREFFVRAYSDILLEKQVRSS
jgi:PadR family transcriptional regulator, regulatory protein PadR